MADAKMIAFIPSLHSDEEGVGVFHLPTNTTTPYCTGLVGPWHLGEGETSVMKAKCWDTGHYIHRSEAFSVAGPTGNVDQAARELAIHNAWKRSGRAAVS